MPQNIKIWKVKIYLIQIKFYLCISISYPLERSEYSLNWLTLHNKYLHIREPSCIASLQALL